MKTFDVITGGKERFLIPVKEAATWLGISAFTLYSWAQSHRIPHYKIGKRVMFSRDDLRRWLEEHKRSVAG